MIGRGAARVNAGNHNDFGAGWVEETVAQHHSQFGGTEGNVTGFSIEGADTLF
jgi:hypothetical protein